jgi:type I restriction enzyme S subunit
MSELVTTTIWDSSRLSDLTKIRYGKSLDKSLRNGTGDFPVVGSAGVMAKTAAPLVSSPCIVVGRKGNVGAVQYFPGGCYPIDTVYYFEAPVNLEVQFLSLYLESQELKNLDSSTAIPSIRREDLDQVEVPLPPLVEQQRIVEILEEEFSRLDAALASICTVREKAKAFRCSLLQAAFDGELSMNGTAAWEVRKFSEVAHVDSNLTDPKTCGDLPHVAPNNIEAGTGRLLEYTTVKADGVTSAKHLFHPGHILYSKIRPYLNKVTLVDFGGLCSADMYPISTSQDAKWLFYVMLSPEFVRLVSGTQNRTVLPKTNVRDLSAITIPVPPISVQHRIVEVLEAELSRLDAALLVTKQLEARIISTRRSLLHAAFTGTLTERWRETHHG